MKTKYTLSPRPNLFFDGDDAVVSWFIKGFNHLYGPHALLIRDNGTPQRVPVTRMKAEDFVHVVGVYKYTVTKDQVMEDTAFFWIRNLGGK